MSMIGVSVGSNKNLQLEAYDRAIVKLNLLLIEDKTYEQAIRARFLKSWTKEMS